MGKTETPVTFFLPDGTAETITYRNAVVDRKLRYSRKQLLQRTRKPR
jgi:hypothetical protein